MKEGNDGWFIRHFFQNKALCIKARTDMRLFGEPITMDYAFGWARKTKTEKRGHYYHAQSCVMEKKVLFFTYDTLKQERHKPYFKEYFKSISELEVQFVFLKLRLVECIYIQREKNRLVFAVKQKIRTFHETANMYLEHC